MEQLVFIIAFTGDHIGPTQISTQGWEFNGIPSSVCFIVCLGFVLNTVLNIINNDGNGDKILNVFAIPKLAVKSLIPIDPPGTTTYWWQILPAIFKENPIIKTLTSTPNNIDGYIPRNNKLRTYPYLYLGFNPQNGTQKIYRYENFANGSPSFKIMSEINPNPSVQFIPQNYRGANGDSLSDNASLNGYPTISYKNDVFNTWLAQNSEIVNLQMSQQAVNYEVSAIKGGMGMIGDTLKMLSGNPSSMADGFNGYINKGLDLISLDRNYDFYIKQQMAQIEKQKLLPDNASLSSSNATLLGYNLLHENIFTRYNIKQEFARKIDKFFDMYGYLTNDIKIPNLNNRPNWNYVKTIGANILGNIPQNDLLTIKELFNNGLTLWHNSQTFLDYSQNNR